MCPYWTDSYALQNTQQGVYYQVNGTTVSFEFYLTNYLDNSQNYHYIVYYNSSSPGEFAYYYFTTSDGGTSETIGGQGEFINSMPSGSFLRNTGVVPF